MTPVGCHCDEGPRSRGVRGAIQPDRQDVNKLKKVGTSPSGVTDGTFLSGCDKIALLTYSSVVVI